MKRSHRSIAFACGMVLLASMMMPAPADGFTLVVPPEKLGGLTPGVDTVADAQEAYGRHDIVLPGDASYYAGGDRDSRAYRWADGSSLAQPGLVIETTLDSRVITLVMVDAYPGIGTSRGLMALMPEHDVLDRYQLPDYTYQIRLRDRLFRELFYIDHGLLVVLTQAPGGRQWIVSKLILTYPMHLRHAVAARVAYAHLHFGIIDDMTHSYRVWAQSLLHPTPSEGGIDAALLTHSDHGPRPVDPGAGDGRAKVDDPPREPWWIATRSDRRVVDTAIW